MRLCPEEVAAEEKPSAGPLSGPTATRSTSSGCENYHLSSSLQSLGALEKETTLLNTHDYPLGQNMRLSEKMIIKV